MSTLKQKYQKDLRPQLQQELGLHNPMSVPRLMKVVVNMGTGIQDKDAYKTNLEHLARITGQKPRVNRARKSISNFKLRAGMNVGATVTLRGARMYEFVERLVNAALPRIRDFRGVSNRAFDGNGNYSLGLRELSIFPEVDPNNVSGTQGMDVCFVTSAKDDKSARALLKQLGMPFAEN